MHVAFFAPSAAGHINPTLGLVSELAQRGHRVTYAMTETYAQRCVDAGAELVPFTSAIGEHDPFTLTGRDLSRGLMANVDETEKQVAELRGFYQENRPDLVVFDGITAWWGRMIARELGVPAVATWTTFTTNAKWSLNDEYVKINPIDLRLWRFVYAVSKLARRARVSMKDLINGVGEGVRSHLVFMPKSFHFANEHFSAEYHFVGPCLRNSGIQGEWTPPESGRPVLLVSLGTIYNSQPQFFRNVLEAVRDGGWHVVMALGEHIDPADLGPLPEHTEVHRFVPQLAVLPHTSLFINHAGISSVMEAVHHEIPMIAVPQMVEQEATADRMEAVGIGRKTSTEEATVERLRTLIAEVSQDAVMKKSLAAYRLELESAGGSRAAADEVERVLAAEPVAV